MRYLSNILVALILAFFLTSDLISINLQHHLRLPSALQTQAIHSQKYWNFEQGFFKVSDVYLSNEIKSSINYMDIAILLDMAKKGDLIRFHLAGYGGDGNTMMFLISHIKNTKAHTVSLVEAPVYSAHTYIAMSTNELIVYPFTFLMFHTVSSHNFDCSQLIGKIDRGQDVVEKCKQNILANDDATNVLIDNISLLTSEEKFRVKDGFDVYISAMEVYNRTK